MSKQNESFSEEEAIAKCKLSPETVELLRDMSDETYKEVAREVIFLAKPIILAKALSSFKKALEQSRKGEPLDLSEEGFELFSAIQNEGIAKAHQKRLDRPDREKKLKELLETTQVEWDGGMILLDGFDELYSKILALFPDTEELKEELRVGNQLTATLTDKCRELELQIEGAKREERERIISELKDYYRIVDKLTPKSVTTIKVKHYQYLFGLTEEDWQALKKEK